MAEWLRAWDTMTMFEIRCAGGREFDPRPGQYTRVVGSFFHPTRRLVRFPHLNMPFLPNSEFIYNIVLLAKR